MHWDWRAPLSPRRFRRLENPETSRSLGGQQDRDIWSRHAFAKRSRIKQQRATALTGRRYSVPQAKAGLSTGERANPHASTMGGHGDQMAAMVRGGNTAARWMVP